MNISTYIPDDLLAEVDAFASRMSLSRSSIIREGLELYLGRHRPDGWPDIIRQWNGDENAVVDGLPPSLVGSDDPFSQVVRSL